jgi:hypothetical protein
MKFNPIQYIRKIFEGRFFLHWTQIPDSQLDLDFNPIIVNHKLTGYYVLLHWQAKPKNFRQWGIYDSFTDNYYSFPAKSFSFGNLRGTQQQLLDISEEVYPTRPTAVVYYGNARIICENGKYILESITPVKNGQLTSDSTSNYSTEYSGLTVEPTETIENQ